MSQTSLSRFVDFEALEDRLLFSATPAVTVTPTEGQEADGESGEDLTDRKELISEGFDFAVTFTNQQDNDGDTSNDVGYGPYVNVEIKAGLDISSAQYLNANLQLVNHFEGAYEVGNIGGNDVEIWRDATDPNGQFQGDILFYYDAVNDKYFNATTQAEITNAGQISTFDALRANASAAVQGLQTFSHPYEGTPIYLAHGSEYYVYNLPFGSFVTEQSTELLFTARTDKTEGAQVDQTIEDGITVTGGFRFGTTATGNGIITTGQAATIDVTPTVWEVRKELLEHENETATGPNYPNTWAIYIDIADGETLSDIEVRDILANSLQFRGAGDLSVTSDHGDALSYNFETYYGSTLADITSAPGGSLFFTIDSATGRLGNDITITYQTYVPEFFGDGAGNITTTSILDPTTGAANTSLNYVDASATYDWGGTMGSGTVTDTYVAPFGQPNDDTLEDLSIAVQKYVDIATSIGGGSNPNAANGLDWTTGVTDLSSYFPHGTLPGGSAPYVLPGEILRYTLNFQVSDYFAFDNVVISDILGDGQTFNADYDVTLTWTEGGVAYTHNFDLSDVDSSSTADGLTTTSYDDGKVLTYYNSNTSGSVTINGFVVNAGETLIQFFVSAQIGLVAGQDTQLVGGLAENRGSNQGATQGRITYQANVSQAYVKEVQPGRTDNIDMGDEVVNSAQIEGRLLRDTDASPTAATWVAWEDGRVVIEDTGTIAVVQEASLTKDLLAINGEEVTSDPSVAPGGTVTYGLELDLSTADTEDLKITDYLPLPKFEATELTNLEVISQSEFAANETAYKNPAAGTVVLVLADDIYQALGLNDPAILATFEATALSSNTLQNSFTVDIGDFQVDPSASAEIQIFFTITATASPMADSLLLTNQARATSKNTEGRDLISNAIVQVTIEEPVVGIQKGVISSTQGGYTSGGSTVGGLDFSGVGTAPSVTGSLTETGSSEIGGLDLNTGVLPDAGDTVRYALVVENTGHSDAFDVQITDTIRGSYENDFSSAAEFVAETNFSVFRGDGTQLTYGTDYTVSWNNVTKTFQVELVDDFVAAGDDYRHGGLNRGNAGDGTNAVVIIYDLTVSENAQSGSTVVNTAEVTNFAGVDNGLSYTGVVGVDGLSDSATVMIATPQLEKVVTDTGVNGTGNDDTQAAVGEWVEYSITITLAEGQTLDVVLSDLLASGMSFVEFTGIDISNGLSFSIGSSAFVAGSTVDLNALIGDGITVGTNGSSFSIDLGSISNEANSNGTAETITITYRAVVLDVSENTDGVEKENVAQLDYSWTDDPSGNPGTGSLSDEAVITVVAPALSIQKSASPNGTSGWQGTNLTGLQAGDQAHYRITISNANGNPTAHNLTFNDALPAGLWSPDGNAFTSADLGTSVTILLNGVDVSSSFQIVGGVLQTVAGSSLDLTAGQSLVIDVHGVIADGVAPSETLENTATVTWDSVEVATPTSYSTDDGVATYSGSDDVTITIEPIDAVKSIIATSQASTSANTSAGGAVSVAVGEVVRYQLAITLPESTVDNLIMVDSLPRGLSFLNDGTYRISFITENGVVDMTSTFTPTVSGNQVSFNFGDIQNLLASDPNSIVVEFNAIVVNTELSSNDLPGTPGGGSDAGDVNPNSFQVTYSAANTVLGTSNTVNVTVVEPRLEITNTMTATGDAGDTVTVTMNVQNDGNATAFGQVITNQLDASKFDVDSIVITPVAGYTSSVTSSGGIITVTWTANDASAMAAGASQAFTFTADLLVAVQSGETLTSNADVTYTSLPEAVDADWTGNAATSSQAGVSGSDGGERTGSEVGANDYKDRASDTILINGPQLVKVVNSTSEDTGNPSAGSVTIGEEITYYITVTVAEGTSGNLVVVDNVQANANGVLQILNAQIVSISGDLFQSDGVTALTADDASFTYSDQFLADGLTDRVTIAFGTVVNTANNAAAETIVIAVTARVVNVAANASMDTLTNSATVTTGTASASGSADVTVVEPFLEVTKDITSNTSNVDAGDSVTYEIVVGHTGASGAAAREVIFSDALPEHLLNPDGVAFSNADLSNGTITIMLDGVDVSSKFEIVGGVLRTVASADLDIELGQELVIEVNGIVANDTPVGSTIANTAEIQWSSLDGGLEGNENGTIDERTGAGSSHNDYIDSDSASLVTQGVLEVSKDADVATATIGQIVNYTITFTVAEGQTVINWSDLLPTGMELVANSIALGTNADGLTITGLNNDSLSGQVLTVTSTSSTNSLTGVETSTFTVTYQARVLNIPSNDGLPTAVDGDGQTALTNTVTAGADLNNDGTIATTGPETVSDSDIVTVVEPNVTIDKSFSVTSGDAGNVLTVTLVVSNTGTSAAYDVSVQDILDSQFFDRASFQLGSTPAGWSSSYAAGTGTLIFAQSGGGGLAAGASATFTFTVALQDNLNPGTEVTNTATVTQSTSLPGEVEGEREQDPVSDPATLTVPSTLTLVKDIVGTSETSTTGSNVTIGEEVTFGLTVTLQEGVTKVVTFRDTLPAGLNYLNGTAVVVLPTGVTVVGATSNISYTNGQAIDAADMTYNAATGQLEFRFVNIDIEATNATGTGSFSVQYDVKVADVATNASGVQLTNSATVSADRNGDGDIVDAGETTPVDTETLTIVEPNVTITKDFDVITGDAGNAIVVTLVVSNTGTSSAWDVIVTDILSDVYFDRGSVVEGTTPAGWTFVYDSDTGALSFTADAGTDVAAGGSATFTFTVNLNSDINPGTVVTNTATVTQSTSLPGEVEGEREQDPVSDPATLTVPSTLTLVKDIVGTSETSTTGNSVAIGEEVTFGLTVTLQEGVTRVVTLNDSLPSGLVYQSGSARFVSSGDVRAVGAVSGTVYTDGSVINAADLVWDPITGALSVSLVDVDVAQTNATGTGQFTIEYTTLVTNAAGLSAGDTLINSATVSADRNGDGDTVDTGETTPPDTETLTIVEPNLVLTKENNDSDGVITRGQTVIYSVNVTNEDTANGSTAFNVVISDRFLTSGVVSDLSGFTVTLYSMNGTVSDLTDDVATTLGAGDYTLTMDGTDGWTITLTDGLQEDYRVEVTYSATFSTTLAANTILDNNARVSFTSVPDTTGPSVRNYVPQITVEAHDESNISDSRQDTDRLTVGDASLGDRVWYDIDGDGVQDTGEVGLGGVTIVLQGQNPDGSVYQLTTTTDANGNYTFAGLAGGSYTVSVSTTTLADGSSTVPTFDLDGTGTPNTTEVSLTNSQTRTDVDFGYHGTGSLGDLVWNDLNGDGVRDAGEPGVEGVNVELVLDVNGNGIVDAGDLVLGNATTDIDGAYGFGNLLSGNYIVRVTNAATALVGSNATFDKDDYGTVEADGFSTVALGIGENDLGVDFGYQGPVGSISDLVWYDINGNGQQDAGELGIPGVVLFIDANGNGTRDDFEAWATTDADGRYIITGLVAGNYVLLVDASTLPEGWAATFDQDDQSGTVTTVNRVEFTLAADENRTDMDFGYRGTYSIGDLIWQDSNRDGIADPAEVGLGNVDVRLYWDANGNGVLDESERANPIFFTDTNGNGVIDPDEKINPLLFATTDQNGNYIFENLFGGDYFVEVVSSTLPGYHYPTYDLDDPINDTDGENTPHVAKVTLAGGSVTDADFGYVYIPPAVPFFESSVFETPKPRSFGPTSIIPGYSNSMVSMYYQTVLDPTFSPLSMLDWELVDSTPIFSSPMLTGHAEPGSKVVLSLYNHRGELISSSTVLVASGGNWAVGFAGVEVNGPVTIVSSVASNDFSAFSSDDNFNYRTNYISGLAGGYFQSREMGIDDSFSNLSYDRLEAMASQDSGDVELGWKKNDYEFLAEPALPGGE